MIDSGLKGKVALVTGGNNPFGIGAAIARALANDPLVLLADEPTGNLDTPTCKQIMDMLSELNERGKTIIMVTHEREIAAYASHHLHMRDGLVASAGETGRA